MGRIKSIILRWITVLGERYWKHIILFGLSCAAVIPIVAVAHILRDWAYFINSEPDVGVAVMASLGVCFILLSLGVAILFIWAIVGISQRKIGGKG